MSDYFRGPQPPSWLSTSANPRTPSTPPEPAGATLAAETAPQVPEDTPGPDEARMRRYAEAARGFVSPEWNVKQVARAVIAVADEEQAALVRQLTDGTLIARMKSAEAEVERLTRECLDRESSETDARERLRRLEALPAELAEVRDMLRGPNYRKPLDRREANAYDHVRERLLKILAVPADTEPGEPT